MLGWLVLHERLRWARLVLGRLGLKRLVLGRLVLKRLVLGRLGLGWLVLELLGPAMLKFGKSNGSSSSSSLSSLSSSRGESMLLAKAKTICDGEDESLLSVE